MRHHGDDIRMFLKMLEDKLIVFAIARLHAVRQELGDIEPFCIIANRGLMARHARRDIFLPDYTMADTFKTLVLAGQSNYDTNYNFLCVSSNHRSDVEGVAGVMSHLFDDGEIMENQRLIFQHHKRKTPEAADAEEEARLLNGRLGAVVEFCNALARDATRDGVLGS